MENIDVVESLAIRIHDELANPNLGKRQLADIGAILFGNNDDDVKKLRDTTGPVAESLYYLVNGTAEFVLIAPKSRQYHPSDPYAFYAATFYNSLTNLRLPWRSQVSTDYLQNLCTPVKIEDISFDLQSLLTKSFAEVGL